MFLVKSIMNIGIVEQIDGERNIPANGRAGSMRIRNSLRNCDNY